MMTNEAQSVTPVDGRFRPESISHFKEVAKNMAWLLERPVQKCQEDLARIYGYSGLHELQQVLKKPGPPGPFAPRYNYLGSETAEAIVEGQDQRIFYILFGVPHGYWRDGHLGKDKSFLVFELGLFQEAAEHRACFHKIKEVLTYGIDAGKWPLVHGWPLGLKSWLASGYTEPYALADDWRKAFPQQAQYAPMGYADISWQRRMTGLVRLAPMFKILASRVGGRKPNGMGKVAFDQFDGEGGRIADSAWEAYCLTEWLTDKWLQKATQPPQEALIEAFVQRPSRATAAGCEFVKDLKDPVAFRDRWAFESFKAALAAYDPAEKALFSSSLDNDSIQSLFLHMGVSSAQISDDYECQLWGFNCTQSKITNPGSGCRMPTLQPIIHANGSLLVPFNENLKVVTHADWLFCHDDSEFASESAALAFEDLYLPAVGARPGNFAYRTDPYSIIEIDELLLTAGVTTADLQTYFTRMVGAFDETCLPDSYGYWCETLSLSFEDDEENEARIEKDEYADYVPTPAVLLINIQGCGLTCIEATHQNGKHISTLKRDERRKPTPSGEALAAMVLEAIKGLSVDVVVYDSGWR